MSLRRSAPRPTVQRRFAFPDHQAPSGKHVGGRERTVWHGTSRVKNKADKRRRNARTWKKILATARREALATKRARAAAS